MFCPPARLEWDSYVQGGPKQAAELVFPHSLEASGETEPEGRSTNRGDPRKRLNLTQSNEVKDRVENLASWCLVWRDDVEVGADFVTTRAQRDGCVDEFARDLIGHTVGGLEPVVGTVEITKCVYAFSAVSPAR